jgi:Kelch motif.
MNLKGVLMLIFLNGIIQIGFSQSITYTNGPNLSVARTQHEMQPLQDGRLLVMGGNNGLVSNYVYFNSCEIYNSQNNAFEAAPAMKDRRSNFMSEVLNNGNIIAIGGDYAQMFGRLSCEIFDITTQQWSYTDSLNASHTGGKAIKLNDGRILAAGGYVAKSEVYDSYTNKWSLVGDMNVNHGRGMSLTLLNNGNVVAIGGDNAAATIEIFSPSTNCWTILQNTTYYNHYGHGALLLPNGKVLIAGSGYSGSNDQSYSELYDPATNSVTTGGLLRINTFYNQLILLDNGRVLTLCMGSIFTPTDTKIFQEYNYTTKTWVASGTYNTLGSTDYTIKRLSNGTIFIAGGNFTTGNGATAKTYVVTQTGYTSCVEPDISPIVSVSSSSCFGSSAKIKLAATGVGVTYYAYSGQNAIGSFTANGESNLEYTIPSNFLPKGKTVISLRVAKSGCVAKKILDTAVITIASQNNTSTNVSILSGANLICNAATPAVLQIDNPIATGSYQWYNASAGVQLSVGESALVTARHIDANGCYGPTSTPVQIRKIVASDFKSEASLYVCNSDAPIQLTASPSGGTWSGTGVSASGLFTPASAALGGNTLTYSLCGFSSTKYISVSSKSIITYNAANIVWPNLDTLCGGANYIITPNGLNVNYKTLFYVNNVLKQTSSPGNATTIYYTPTVETTAVFTFKITYFTSGACPNDTLVISRTYPVAPKPSTTISRAIIPATWCSGSEVKIAIVQPQVGVAYYAAYYPEYQEQNQGVKKIITQPVDTLFIYAGGPGTVSIMAAPNRGCKNAVYLESSKTIVPFNKSNELTLGDVYYVGETVAPVLTSNMDSFKWKVDATNYTTQNPPAKVYNSIGTHSYEVISISGYGCSDTIRKNVFIVKKPSVASMNTCLFDTSKIANSTNLLRSIIDKKGNTIYVGTKFVDYGANYTGSENGFIEKYGKDGAPIWSINHDPYDYFESSFFSFVVSAVTVDDNNDLYITGNYSAKKLKFLGAQFVNSESTNSYSHVFVAKISEAGNLLWMISSFHGLNSIYANSRESGGTDVQYVNGKVYVSARIMSQGLWKNHLGAEIVVQNPANVKEFSIFEINTSGTSIKAIAYMDSDVFNHPNGKANILGFVNLTGGSMYHTEKIAIISPLMKPLPNNKLLIHGRLKDYMSFGTTTLTAPTIDGVKQISEFSIILNLNTNTWESPTLEASINGDSPQLFGLVGFVKLNAVYNAQLDKFSAINMGNESYAYIPTETKVYINSTDIETYTGDAVLLKRVDKSGNLLWKQLIKGGKAEQIFISSDEAQIVVVGEYKLGINFLYKNQDFGLTHTTTAELYAMGFSAETGNLIWAEKIGTKDFDDTYLNAVLSSCNDLLIMGYRKQLYLADALGAVGHGTDSLRYTSAYPYQIRIPLTGICGSTNCNLITTDIASETSVNGSQLLLYPNPTTGQLTVKAMGGKSCQMVVITDLQGRNVKTVHLHDESETVIDVSDLISGMYLVETFIEGQVIVGKINVIH